MAGSKKRHARRSDEDCGGVMGEMADYDLYENINNVGRVEGLTYTCGYCRKNLGTDLQKAKEHVNNCEALKIVDGE